MAGRIQRQSANLPGPFQDGYLQFSKRNYREAELLFQQTLDQTSQSDPRRNKFVSYLGLCKVLLGDTSGLVMCRKASDHEAYDGDVFANLALAEFRCNCRRRAFGALSRGMRVDPSLTRLRLIHSKMDMRRPPVIGLLERDHPLNVMLGRICAATNSIRYRSKSASADTAIMDLCLSKRAMFI